MYTIKKQHFTTTRPHRVDDATMFLAEDQMPLGIDFGNLMYDIASLMAEFHDSVTSLDSSISKYSKVLQYDSRLRAIATDSLPLAFSSDTAEPHSPFVSWAKTATKIICGHKIMAIHRSFLGKSFTEGQFAYSRWASIEASKTILQEVEASSTVPERPSLWNELVKILPPSVVLS